MSPILFNPRGEYLMKEALAEVGVSRLGEGLLIGSDLRMIRLLYRSKNSRRVTRYGGQIG